MARLRRARFWAVPITLVTVAALLVQPTFCVLMYTGIVAARRAALVERASVAPASRKATSAVPDSVLTRFASRPKCCATERLTEGATPPPSNGGLHHSHTSMPVLASAVGLIAPVLAPVRTPRMAPYRPPPRVLPYHARSARLLI